MKILFSYNLPCFLAHGGLHELIQRLREELLGLGIEVEWERWWDAGQRGDVLQYFGRPPTARHVELAHGKGFQVVMFESLDQTASRSRGQLRVQRAVTRLARRFFPGATARLAWEAYREVDAMIYVTQPEWETAQYLFDAPPGRGQVIGHGLAEAALAALAKPDEDCGHLVCVATIAGRKNTVALARAARQGGTPVVFLGKPYAEDDSVFHEFKSLVDGRTVIYPGFVSEEEKWRWLRQARGFVLLSQFESGSIAVYEAAAAGLPMLLADLPWATRVYGGIPGITFANPAAPTLAERLRQFHMTARRQPQPTFPVPSWQTVARAYLKVYEQVLAERRGDVSASQPVRP